MSVSINPPSFPVVIAADHAGFALKEHLLHAFPFLRDLGAFTCDKNDAFPSFTPPVVKAVKEEGALGILVCGTGIGISIAANRHRGIYAALCTNEEMAMLARLHNKANILCLGGRIISKETAEQCLKAFLETQPLPDRKYHERMESLDQ